MCGSPDARWTVVLAHGAGQGMQSPFMRAFAVGLAARGGGIGGIQTVRFNFPYMAVAERTGRPTAPNPATTLTETWREVIAELEQRGHPRDRLAIGGKSLGGRIATLVATDQGVAAVLCLGFPFHPPGRPERTRLASLETIQTPTLICQGERDPFGNLDEVMGCYRLSRMVQLHWLVDGDHSFRPRKRSGLNEAQNWDSAIDAICSFLAELG